MSLTVKDLRNSPIENLAKKILGKDLVSDKELEDFFDIESRISIGQMSISATETRQIRPYETNSYFLSIQFDLSGLKQFLEEVISRKYSTPQEELEAFLSAKQLIIKSIQNKYAVTENMIREMIKEQQKGDGIKV